MPNNMLIANADAFFDDDFVHLTLTLGKDNADNIKLFLENFPFDQYEVTIKKRRKKKRSISINAYFWVLLDQIAAMLHTTKEELYKDVVRADGVFTVAEMKSEAFPRFRADLQQVYPRVSRLFREVQERRDQLVPRDDIQPLVPGKARPAERRDGAVEIGEHPVVECQEIDLFPPLPEVVDPLGVGGGGDRVLRQTFDLAPHALDRTRGEVPPDEHPDEQKQEKQGREQDRFFHGFSFP